MVEKSILRVETLASSMALPARSARLLMRTRHETTATTRFLSDGRRQIDFVLAYEADRNQKLIERSSRMVSLDERSVSNQQAIKPENSSSKQDDDCRRYFEHNLERFGLDLETETCFDENDYFNKKTNTPKRILIFIKIHAPWKVLAHGAEELRLKMPLKLRDKRTFKVNSSAWKFSQSVKRNWKRLTFFRSRAPLGAGHSARGNGIVDDLAASHPQRINAPFTSEDEDKFDMIDKNSFFDDRHRIEIVWELLQKIPCDPNDCRKRGIEFLLARKIYDAAYPLHDGDAPFVNPGDFETNGGLTRRQVLKSNWADWKAFCFDQPLDQVREYFGEKIAFYFLFMDFYTKMLILPAIFGLLTFLYGLVYTDYYSDDMKHVCDNNTIPGKFLMCPICQPPDCDPWPMADEGCLKYKWEYRIDNFGSFIHTCLTTLWSIIFFKMWKRHESRVSVLWDTYDAEEHDRSIRPAYEQRAVYERQNPITGESEKYIPSHYKTFWMTVSILVTLAMLLIDSASLLVLVMSRIALYGWLKNLSFHTHIAAYNVEYARWTVHGLILIMILIFERVFSYVAHVLTNYECPKSQKHYTTSLLWKLFIFELLNDFIPLGYAAWMKQTWVKTPRDLNFLSELCDGGCLSEVAELITILLLARLTIGNALEICVPYIKNYYSRRFHPVLDESERKLPRWVKDYKLNKVELDGVYTEYMEMMVQFSFVVMFVPASPVAALVCFLNNIFEIRIDSMKLLVTKRRPVPIRVPGVQIWNRFMDILVKVGIVCNAALLAFTSEIVPRFYYEYLYKNSDNFTGYTHFSLSEISTTGWLPLSKGHNDSACYYQDSRERDWPYNLKPEFWEVSTARVSMFALYSCSFFILMWLINLLIDDMPADVKDRIKRNKYLVATVGGTRRRNTTASRKSNQSLTNNKINNGGPPAANGLTNNLNDDVDNASPDDNKSNNENNSPYVIQLDPSSLNHIAGVRTIDDLLPAVTLENMPLNNNFNNNLPTLPPTTADGKTRRHLLPPIENTIQTSPV